MTHGDYISHGATQDDVLAMFYEFPLAPIYREKRHLVFRDDGKVHGVFQATQTIFHVTPQDPELWQLAYDANLALFPPTPRA